MDRLTEQDKTELFQWWMDYDDGEKDFQDLEPVVEEILERHLNGS